MTRPERSARGLYVHGILAILAAFSVWPYLRAIGFEPMAFDDAVWISRGFWSRPDWVDWVWRTRQLGVGYRPITALTFTLDSALAGFAMPLYRCTDLLLHVAAGILVFALFRRLARDASGWASLLASAVFLLHPATEEVVPYLARRSYSLATVFALAALIQFHETLREDRGTRRLVLRSGCAAILLALGVLSNETAVGVLPMAGFAMGLGALERRPGWKAWAVAASVPAATMAAVLLVRSRVVVGLGGYETSGEGIARFSSVFLAAWRDIVAFQMSFGRTPPAYPLWRVGVLAVVATYYLARVGAAVTTAGWWKRPPLFVLAFAWLVGYGVLYASLGVWFPRQAYSMLPALATFLVACLVFTVRTNPARPVRLAAHLLPQLVFLGMLFSSSPSVRGPDPTRMQNWEGTERLLLHLRADLSSVSGPAVVHLVLPYREQLTRFNPLWRNPVPGALPLYFVRLPSRWLSTLLDSRGIRVEDFLFIQKEDPAGRLQVVDVEGTPAILFPREGTYFMQTPVGFVRRIARPGDAVLLAPPTPPPRFASFVYVWDDRSGASIEAPRGL